MRLDPVTLALVQKRVDHIAERMGQVMLRTARSPIFNQSHDFSCFLTDGSGRLVSQADGIPIHTGGGGLIVEAVLAAFDDIAPGDVFISSDPYVAGGNHLPDWVVSRPVFIDGGIFAFVCNRAHQSDIGGGVAGTYNPAATEIFHEGIRLPPLRLIEKGRLRRDLWDLLLLNSRCAELLDGVYTGAEMTDNDCFVEREVWIRVTITKTGDRLRVDYSGSDPQMKGFKNSSISNTRS